MKAGPALAAFSLLLLHGLALAAEDWDTVRLLRSGRSEESISSLSWDGLEFPLEWSPEGRQVLLRGFFSLTDGALIHGDEVVSAPARGEREFELRVPLHGDAALLRLLAVGPLGEVESETILLRFQSAGAEGPGPSSRKLRFSASLGVSSIEYREPGVADLSLIAATLKAALSWAVFPPRWDLGANVFGSAFAISSSRPDLGVRFLGANARFGYVVPFVREPWRFSVLTGLYYTTMFVSGSRLGYRNLLYPQLFPTLRWRIDDRNAVATYVKYVPLGAGLALFDTRERELAWGTSWERRLSSGHPVSVSLDLADLAFEPLPGTRVSSTSASLGFGYGW